MGSDVKQLSTDAIFIFLWSFYKNVLLLSISSKNPYFKSKNDVFYKFNDDLLLIDCWFN